MSWRVGRAKAAAASRPLDRAGIGIRPSGLRSAFRARARWSSSWSIISSPTPLLPASRMRPSTARAAASSSICSVTNHCSITVAGRSLVFSAIGVEVVDGRGDFLLVLEHVIAERFGGRPSGRWRSNRGQHDFLIALDEVVDDPLRVHQLVGGLLAHPLRKPRQVVLGQPDGHGQVFVRRAKLELEMLVEAVQQVTVHDLTDSITADAR